MEQDLILLHTKYPPVSDDTPLEVIHRNRCLQSIVPFAGVWGAVRVIVRKLSKDPGTLHSGDNLDHTNVLGTPCSVDDLHALHIILVNSHPSTKNKVPGFNVTRIRGDWNLEHPPDDPILRILVQLNLQPILVNLDAVPEVVFGLDPWESFLVLCRHTRTYTTPLHCHREMVDFFFQDPIKFGLEDPCRHGGIVFIRWILVCSRAWNIMQEQVTLGRLCGCISVGAHSHHTLLEEFLSNPHPPRIQGLDAICWVSSRHRSS